MILYIAFNDSTYEYKKYKEQCFEGVICHPLGLGLVGNSSGSLSQELGGL